MKILIKNGRVIDSANNRDGIFDILVEDNLVSKIDSNIRCGADMIIDASDKIVIPGLVDMHVHLREPGREDKETIGSATKAAAKGGITSLLSMPNTNPAIDCPERVEALRNIIKKDAKVNVFISASITKERLGQKVCCLSHLKKKGAIAITDDGASVDSDKVMTIAIQKAKKSELLVICHSEDKSLSKGGVVNLGFTSTRLGLKGISRESEYKRVARDIDLIEKEGGRGHIAHVSCRESVEIIARAKKRGVKITAETAPHYFSLTEEAVLGFDTNMKMNPPLRSREDLESIRQGLKNGVIDVIASDHAPHTLNEKDIEFDRAEFGVIGLETEFAVSISELINGGVLTWTQLVEKSSYNPAKILGINKGQIIVGQEADIVVVDPKKEWVVEKEGIISKSKNSCFLGKKLQGVVEYTICNGKVVYKNTE